MSKEYDSESQTRMPLDGASVQKAMDSGLVVFAIPLNVVTLDIDNPSRKPNMSRFVHRYGVQLSSCLRTRSKSGGLHVYIPIDFDKLVEGIDNVQPIDILESAAFEATWAGSDPIREMLNVRRSRVGYKYAFKMFETSDAAEQVRRWAAPWGALEELTREKYSAEMRRINPDVDLDDWDVPF